MATDISSRKIISQHIDSFRPRAFVETFDEWLTTKSEDADPVFTFFLRPSREVVAGSFEQEPRRFIKQHDAFEVRKSLFKVKGPTQALEFFQSFGPWQLLKSLDNQSAGIKFSQVERRRDFYKGALLHKTVSNRLLSAVEDSIPTFLDDLYLWQDLPMQMPFGQRPFVRCKDIEDALRATFFIDKLDGLPWRPCASERCGNVFKIEKDPRKMYCDPLCARYQAATDWNRREQKKRALAAPTKPKKG
jgi:hypothetical protein